MVNGPCNSLLAFIAGIWTECEHTPRVVKGLRDKGQSTVNFRCSDTLHLLCQFFMGSLTLTFTVESTLQYSDW